MPSPLDRAVDAAVDALGSRLGGGPEVAVVLGSGLGGVGERWSVEAALDLASCPGLPVPRVAGHEGGALLARVGGRRTLFVLGRVHLYEGYDAPEVAAVVRVLAGLGCPRLVLTCASGSVAPALAPGALVGIRDHLNLTGTSPLRGPRFVPMARAWREDLYPADLPRAVLAGLRGPSYETGAEAEMLRRLGADIVSMSTVTEAIAARAEGMELAGLSVVTNRAGGGDGTPESHERVVARAEGARAGLWDVLEEIVARWEPAT